MFTNLSGAYSRPTDAFPEADLSRSSSPCLMPRRKSLESGATTELALSGTDGSTHPPSSGESGANVEIGARLYGSINAELKVRIRFPPAESQVRTRLSREFAFLGREAAVFRGCPGRDERPGSAETRGRGNIWPKGGDISVGPYSSTCAYRLCHPKDGRDEP